MGFANLVVGTKEYFECHKYTSNKVPFHLTCPFVYIYTYSLLVLIILLTKSFILPASITSISLLSLLCAWSIHNNWRLEIMQHKNVFTITLNNIQYYYMYNIVTILTIIWITYLSTYITSAMSKVQNSSVHVLKSKIGPCP